MGVQKKERKFFKISPVFSNFDQFNNCPFLSNYKLCLVVWHRKAAEQRHNFCQSLCLTVRSPIISLKFPSWYMYRYVQKNSGYSTAIILRHLLYLLYFCQCLSLRVYMSNLCDIFFTFIFIFIIINRIISWTQTLQNMTSYFWIIKTQSIFKQQNFSLRVLLRVT